MRISEQTLGRRTGAPLIATLFLKNITLKLIVLPVIVLPKFRDSGTKRIRIGSRPVFVARRDYAGHNEFLELGVYPLLLTRLSAPSTLPNFMKKLIKRYLDPNVLKQFLQQEADPDIQFLKYAIAGAAATAFHIIAFHLIAWKIFPALQAEDLFVKILGLTVEPLEDSLRSRNAVYSNLTAFIFSNLFCWIINRAWVFAPGRHHILVELGLFYLASAAAIGTGTVLMAWLIHRFGMITTLAFCANLVTSLLINYAMRKFVIFKG